MKRLWNDLGALLPASFVGAHVKDAIGTVAEDDSQPMRSPKKENPDDGAEDQPEAEGKSEGAGPQGQAGSSAESSTAGAEAATGSTPGEGRESDGPSSPEIGLPKVATPEYSMYSPTTAQLTPYYGGGGGSAGTVPVTSVTPANGQVQPTPAVGNDIEPSGDPVPLPLEPPVDPVNDGNVVVDANTPPPTGGSEGNPQGGGGNQPASGNEADLDDADSMMVMLGGWANSVGPNGTTSGDIDLEIVDYGAVTVAYGYATFMSTSTGEHSDEGSADTFVDVLGADMVFAHEFNYDFAIGTGPNAGYTDYSTTLVIAIDFEGDSGDGVALVGSAASGPLSGLADLPPALLALLDTESGENVAVDGNTALLDFDLVGDGDLEGASVAATTSALEDTSSSLQLLASWADSGLSVDVSAIGPDTIASFDGSLLEVEDQFSSVGGLVIAAA